MHVSMFLGFWDGLINVAMNIVNAILGFILKIVMNYVVVPLIQLIILVIKYLFSGIFYSIGTFILRLVDFLESFFRVLAGLDGKVGDMDATLVYGNGEVEGDILIQIIGDYAVRDAFLSMVIVGLFLLLVTTVFQMIKVEYTTEGAKNSKTPIIQKAFRSLANLLLLPALVVLGIFFANSLLGLLDTATGGGDKVTISGLVFSCAASQAFYRKAEVPVTINSTSMWDVALEGITAMSDSLVEDLFGQVDTSDENASSGRVNVSKDAQFAISDPDRRNDVIEGFKSQMPNYKYYLPGNVTHYFNIAEINYVVMIFGGAIVLKCLFFTCFGLINRLYKCVMLFIISPVVIGMTPINEGGLGKWRTAFIGQVLAAYGTVITLNLFFIILTPMLNIRLGFANSIAGPLSNDLLSMLVQLIIVVAGFLLIENFAKDIGGYFGADDAMASGKDTAGKIGDTVRKGVTTVAAGGAMLAMGTMAIGKGAQGLSDKIKQRKEEKSHSEKGVGKATYKATMKEMKKQDKEYKKSGDTGSMRSRKDRRNAATRAAENEMAKYREQTGAFRSIQNADKGIADQKAENDKLLQQAQEAYDSGHNELGDELYYKAEAGDAKIKDLEKQKAETTKALGGADSETYKEAQGLVEAEDKVARDQAARKNARREKISAAGMRATSTFMGLAQQGMNSAPGGKWRDFVRKAETDGSKLMGDNYEAATAGAAKAREDRIKGVGETIGGKAEAAYTAAGAAILANSIADSMGHKMQQSTREINQEIKNLADVLQNMSEDKREDYFAARFDSLKSKGLNMEYGEFKAHVFEGGEIKGNINQKLELSAEKLGMTLNPKDIEKAVAEAMKNGGSTKAIADAVKSVFEKVAKDGNVALLSMLTKVIEEKISQLGSK